VNNEWYRDEMISREVYYNATSFILSRISQIEI